jgi:hypothetical protein
MNKKALLAVAAALVAVGTATAQAEIKITEVAPWSSGNSPVGADWFELTNTGASAIDIAGWTMDDASANPDSSLLTGITNINPHESVIFIELQSGGDAAALKSSFISTWFGLSAPSGLQIGTYTQGVAGGVGLGTGGDAVNIFDGIAGTLQASVTFGPSDNVTPYQTFDNAAGLNGTTISQLSLIGVNGAFLASAGGEIGSPGLIAAPVPEPSTYALMLAGLGLVGFLARKRQR